MTTRNMDIHGDIIDPNLPVETICDHCDVNEAEYDLDELEIDGIGDYNIQDVCDLCIKEVMDAARNEELMCQKCGEIQKLYEFFAKHLCLECIKSQTAI